MQMSALAMFIPAPGWGAVGFSVYRTTCASLLAMLIVLVGAAALADDGVGVASEGKASAGAEGASSNTGAATQPPTGPGQAPRVTVTVGDVVVDVRQDGAGEAGPAPRAPQQGQGGQDQSRKKKDKKDKNPARNEVEEITGGVSDQDRPGEGESAADLRDAEQKNVQTMMNDADTNRRKAIKAHEELAPEIKITPPDEGMLDLGADDKLGDL